MVSKTFRYGNSIIKLIDPLTYIDGSLIQYEITIMPEITVHRWEELSAVDQTQIENRASAKGWDVVE